jgi:hypothetical protein
MELNLFNKINRNLQFVNESFTNFQRNYGEFNSNYIGYDRVLVENQPNASDILQQFEVINTRQLFRTSHIENNHYGENYLDIPATRFTENRVGVHYELTPYLFYYLANSLIVEIRNFLHLVRSEEFKINFTVDVNITDGNLKYSFNRHNQISSYIRERIPLYNRLFNLLNQSTKIFLAISSSDPYFEIELDKLDKILANVENIYRFDVIEIN